MSAVLDVLRAGRERVARGWSQNYFARDAAGNGCPVNSRKAKCWCAVGAVYAAATTHPVRTPALERLREALPGASRTGEVEWFNDHPLTTQADVLALFDRAIAALETA